MSILVLLNDNSPNKRIYGLDILRAFAILFVMHSHGYAYSGHIVGLKYYWWATLDGVGLFFVLSGFLIGGILIKTINKTTFTRGELLTFWTRRWFRTLPNYYLVLCILTAAYIVSHHGLPPKLFRYFTFTQCFAWQHPLFFGEAWSLAVEEWFYLLIPFGLYMVLYIAKGEKQYLLLWIFFVLIAGTAIRVVKVAQQDYFADGSFGLEVSKQVITRMDGIMFGMLGAWLSFYRPTLWLKYKNQLFIAGIVLLFGSRLNIGYSLFFYGYFYFTTSALGTLFLLPKLNSITTGKGFFFKVFTFISIISYSMYLTNHMIVQRGILLPFIHRFNIDNSPSFWINLVLLILFWGLTILFSWVIYRFWEKPWMKFRDRISIMEQPLLESKS